MRLALCVGTPMVGFGIADNAIMILAGDRIDATFGVAFGFSTMAAAGLGNLISDVCGISLGEVIEGWCVRAGLEAPELTAAQSAQRATRVVKWAAGALGITIGCLLGMAPLLFISDRKGVYFSDDDLALYQRQFAQYGVTPEQFFALMQSGAWHSAEEGSQLVRQGERMDRVMLIHSGCAESWTQMPDGTRENIWIYTGKGNPEPDAAEPKDAAFAAATHAAAEAAARRGQLRGCIIGGTALVEPEVLSKPYPNQVVVTHQIKYVTWKTEELRAAMKEDKSIESAVYSTLYLDLVEGLRRQRYLNRTTSDAARSTSESRRDASREYSTMMRAVVADGLVHPLEKSMLSDFADKHDIEAAEHLAALQAVGWTLGEWEEGLKRDVKSLRLSGAAPSADAADAAAPPRALPRNASRLPDGYVNSAPRAPPEAGAEPAAVRRKPLKPSLTVMMPEDVPQARRTTPAQPPSS